MLMGRRKATKPAKKRSRDIWRRSGINSTMVCMPKRWRPKYRYEKIRARMTGEGRISVRCMKSLAH
jgi:hypothetical protein